MANIGKVQEERDLFCVTRRCDGLTYEYELSVRGWHRQTEQGTLFR